MSEPRAQLARALLSMFSSTELRRLVRLWPEGDALSAELPGDLSSPHEFVHATVDALSRHGLLDDRFFRLLEEARPRRREEIQEIRDALLRRPEGQGVGGAPVEGPVWDFFISYPREERDAAEALTMELAHRARVFLDAHSLVPGERWDLAIHDALTRSRIIVVLVSGRAERAYYQRDEIAAALQLARSGPGTHRVVPVWLSKSASASSDLPYGLRGISGLFAESQGMDGVAAQLVQLRDRLIQRDVEKEASDIGP